MARERTLAVLMALSSAVAVGCSSEDVKRTGYETLQNIREQRCQEGVAADCRERQSYQAYRQQIEGTQRWR